MAAESSGRGARPVRIFQSFKRHRPPPRKKSGLFWLKIRLLTNIKKDWRRGGDYIAEPLIGVGLTHILDSTPLKPSHRPPFVPVVPAVAERLVPIVPVKSPSGVGLMVRAGQMISCV